VTVTFDDLVRRLGDRLARPADRRRFVGSMTTGAAVLATGPLLTGCGDDQPQRRGDEGFKPIDESRPPKGVYGQDQVAVCYTPYEVVATEPRVEALGKTGVAVRKAPHEDAEIVLDSKDAEVFVPVGTHIAKQSGREGRTCDELPPDRPAVNGYVWGYPADDVPSNKSGWIPQRVDGTRYLRENPDYVARPAHDGYVCGPASKDFDCRTVKSQKPCNHDDCGGPPIEGIRCRATPLRRRVRKALSRKTSNFEDYYLRLSYNSTAFGWLEPDDVVDEICRRSAPSYGRCCAEWSFVEVVRSEAMPIGTRGWILETGLARKTRKPLSRTGPPPRKKR